LKPTRSRVPMSAYRMECLVVVSMGRAVSEEGLMRKQWLTAGLAVWLCFSCMLRPGELLNLRRRDISFPDGDFGNEEMLGAVVIIRRPKTRRIWKEQFVLCRDVKLVRWLRWWLDEVSGSRLFFPFSRYV